MPKNTKKAQVPSRKGRKKLPLQQKIRTIMETDEFFTTGEKRLLFVLYRKLLQLSGDTLHKGDCKKLKTHLVNSIQNNRIQRDIFGLNPIIKDMQTAVIVAEEIGMKRASILGLMLHDSVRCGTCTSEEVERGYGEDVAGIIRGLIRVNELYSKSPTIESENFRNLLLSFAEDMRVILIMIADRVNVMRQIKDSRNDEARKQVANEAAYLYAPLAHKLGLYKLKSELEDLSLKYTEKDVYYHIKEKLNETKASRDRYIAAFIAPVQKKLEEAGLHFHIKGRTKSIHSIYQKMKKQKCPFEWRIRLVRHSRNSGLRNRKGETGMLAGILHRNGYVPAQPQAFARLAVCAQKQWLRVVAHHRNGPRSANGWKCRYAPNVWTKLPNAALQRTGDIRESKVKAVWTNGLLPYVKRWKTPTVVDWRQWTSSSWTYTKTKCSSSLPKETYLSWAKVPPYSTSLSISTANWVANASEQK